MNKFLFKTNIFTYQSYHDKKIYVQIEGIFQPQR